MEKKPSPRKCENEGGKTLRKIPGPPRKCREGQKNLPSSRKIQKKKQEKMEKVNKRKLQKKPEIHLHFLLPPLITLCLFCLVCKIFGVFENRNGTPVRRPRRILIKLDLDPNKPKWDPIKRFSDQSVSKHNKSKKKAKRLTPKTRMPAFFVPTVSQKDY